MAIGKRIKFFRNKKGMTQKQFGEMLGFLGKTSDVRMAQYEAEARIPKFDLLKEMAGILSVSTHALNVPDIDSYIGLMHTFFALEDMYGLKIKDIDGELQLHSLQNGLIIICRQRIIFQIYFVAGVFLIIIGNDCCLCAVF